MCSCKYGHLLSDAGELICAPERYECLVNEDCATSMACALGRCYDPCAVREGDPPLCEGNKTCSVVHHRPVCLCTDDCNPSLTMCLRDAGCSPKTSCRNYECIDPCANFTCQSGAHCFVENHVPVCKFCADGWTFDAREGCIQSKDTRWNDASFLYSSVCTVGDNERVFSFLANLFSSSEFCHLCWRVVRVCAHHESRVFPS